MRGILIEQTTEGGHLTPSIRELSQGDNSEISKLLNVDLMDMVSLKPATHESTGYDVWLDDEALLKNDTPFWQTQFGNGWLGVLAGRSVLVVGTDIDGNVVGLSHEDCEVVLSTLRMSKFKAYGRQSLEDDMHWLIGWHYSWKQTSQKWYSKESMIFELNEIEPTMIPDFVDEGGATEVSVDVLVVDLDSQFEVMILDYYSLTRDKYFGRVFIDKGDISMQMKAGDIEWKY